MTGLVDSWCARRSGRLRHQEDVRTDFEVDYGRVIHSGAFRRLQGKTQILALGDDDFYRSRLTHSMEVAQVAEGIAQHLRAVLQGKPPAELVPPTPLIHAIGLSHDIGHPPFGHGGELALNYCMREAGGFEGNAQTLRLLTRLENFSESDGADLTRRTLLGVLKYPTLYYSARNPERVPALALQTTTISVLDRAKCKPVKACYDSDAPAFEWVLDPLPMQERDQFMRLNVREGDHALTLHKSFDCAIMDCADDIAYGVHDLEDAIALGFVSEDDFRAAVSQEVAADCIEALARRPLFVGDRGTYDELVSRMFGIPSARKAAIGRFVHYFIRAVELLEHKDFTEPLLRWRAALRTNAAELLEALKRLIADRVISAPRVQHLEFKGQRMVVAVFEAVASDPQRLLPRELFQLHRESAEPMRVICDYIASFTDGALLRTYERLFSPRMGSVFDRI